jgi:hypothetical protein
MQRIDGPGATQDNHFQDRDVPGGIEGTEVISTWLNAVQEELCSVVERTGGTLDRNQQDQVLQAILGLVSQGGSGAAGIGTNQVINGEFRWFQAATSSPSGVLTRVLAAGITAYCHDQWEYSPDATGGTGAATVSRQPFVPGQTAVPGNPLWYARMAQGSVANLASPYVRTKLEDVAHYSGGPFTWSIYLRATAAVAATLRIVQRFGSGGSGDVIVATNAVTLGTLYQRYSVSIPNLPDVTGKVIGPGNHLLLELVLPTGQSFTLDLADSQAEKNGAATVFQRRSETLELELVRRYYEKSWPADVAAATCPGPNALDGATAAQFDGGPIIEEMIRRFRTEKRATPSITWYSTQSQNAGFVYASGNERPSGPTLHAGPSSTGCPSTGSSGAAGLVMAHWVADARL